MVSKEDSEINSKYNWTIKDGVAVIELDKENKSTKKSLPGWNFQLKTKKIF